MAGGFRHVTADTIDEFIKKLDASGVTEGMTTAQQIGVLSLMEDAYNLGLTAHNPEVQ